jgi:hypothetical protein
MSEIYKINNLFYSFIYKTFDYACNNLIKIKYTRIQKYEFKLSGTVEITDIFPESYFDMTSLIMGVTKNRYSPFTPKKKYVISDSPFTPNLPAKTFTLMPWFN